MLPLDVNRGDSFLLIDLIDDWVVLTGMYEAHGMDFYVN
ncbi:hypothetical protein DSOL_1074 [Desulfosporosinus metallidurans]|uniref:Uncharacterized protein n=1 Tax=Desulfosporosinus metallidurans TaxID=1888891 RepID=A0A1Q8R023_9FIRM|nr:hypothetical protein DSOL_1074 [Desulfosporosinus metallidurans]